MDGKSPSQLLHEAVRREIAKGDVKASAEAWDVNLRTLTEIRSAPVNTGIETFAKICKGLGLSADELTPRHPLKDRSEILRSQVLYPDELRAHVASIQQLTVRVINRFTWNKD